MLTVGAIAERVGGQVEGDASASLTNVAAVADARQTDLTFAVDASRVRQLAGCRAGAALVPREAEVAAAMPLIRVADVEAALATVLATLAPPDDVPPPGVHPSAVVDGTAELGEGVAVGPHAVVGAGARVGAGSVLCAGVSVGAEAVLGRDVVLRESAVVGARCRLGDRVRIGPNATVGHDGFGYYSREGVHHAVPHIGNVVIEDDVDLGAGACVDRAKFGSTWIGAGTKMDNFVQIAHNCRVGPGCLLAAHAALGGSVRLGRHVSIGGHAAVAPNVTVGDGVRCAGLAGVHGDVPAGAEICGIPAGPARDRLRAWVAQDQLPGLLRRVRALEASAQDGESPAKH